MTKEDVSELLIIVNKKIDDLEFMVDYYKDDPLSDWEPTKRCIKRLKHAKTSLETHQTG